MLQEHHCMYNMYTDLGQDLPYRTHPGSLSNKCEKVCVPTLVNKRTQCAFESLIISKNNRYPKFFVIYPFFIYGKGDVHLKSKRHISVLIKLL